MYTKFNVDLVCQSTEIRPGSLVDCSMKFESPIQPLSHYPIFFLMIFFIALKGIHFEFLLISKHALQQK